MLLFKSVLSCYLETMPLRAGPADQINRRRRDGAAVCIVVMVKSSGVDV